MNRRTAAWECAVLVALLVWVPRVAAQIPGGDQPLLAPVAQPSPNSLSANLVVPAAPDTYIVGNEDVLTVLVNRMDSLTGQFKVDNHGDILLPFLRQPIHVAGATAPQIAQRIRRRLVDTRLAFQPQVRVVVEQVASHLVVVSGAVNHPVVLQAVRPLTLAEAIARAGGLSDRAGDQVRIRTLPEAGGTPQVMELPLDAIVQGAQTGPLLTGRESVQVEPARFVYVVGSVIKAGAFPVTVDQPMTLLRAVALAQGIRDPADRSHVRIMYPGTGTEPPKLVVVNLKALLNNKSEDITLRSGAIVYIPESTRSRVLTQVLNASVQTLVLAVGYNASRIF